MRKLSIHAVAASCFCIASPLNAETIHQEFTIAQGTKIMMGAIYALKDDCSPGPFPQIKMNKMPSNGRIDAGRANFPIATDKHCPNVFANSLAISYFPYPNFTGEEKISANVVMSNGKVVEYNWTVKVNSRVQSSLQTFVASDVVIMSR